ncbi:MAG: hypothetical protein KIG91_05555 [Treponema sp.]|nr:hypothetical protein [Treponema sp.]
MQIVWHKKSSEERVFTIIFLVSMELLLQATVSAIYLGWDGGYQNFCFIIFATSFLNIY